MSSENPIEGEVVLSLEEAPKPKLVSVLRSLATENHNEQAKKLKEEILEAITTNAKAGVTSYVHQMEALPLQPVIKQLEEYFNGENLQFTVHKTNGNQGFFRVTFNLDV